MAATFDVLRFSQASAVFMVVIGIGGTSPRPARSPSSSPVLAVAA